LAKQDGERSWGRKGGVQRRRGGREKEVRGKKLVKGRIRVIDPDKGTGRPRVRVVKAKKGTGVEKGGGELKGVPVKKVQKTHLREGKGGRGGKGNCRTKMGWGGNKPRKKKGGKKKSKLGKSSCQSGEGKHCRP